MNDLFGRYDWTGLTVKTAAHSMSVSGDIFYDNVSADKYQLGVKFDGRTDVEYDGKPYPFYGGSILYLPKEKRTDIVYTRKITEGGHGVYIFFDSMYPLPPYPVSLRLNNPEKVCEQFRKLANLFAVREFNGFERMSTFYKLLAALKDDMSANEGADRSRRMLAEAEAYISEKYTDEYIDISIPAKIAGMTPEYFRRCFARVYGDPPLRYVNRLKCDRAKLLLMSGKSVSETAEAVGFRSANYFSRFFRHQTGVSPTEFVRFALA